MGTRKQKTQNQMSSSKRIPTKVETPQTKSKLKPKSDLTLAFMDSSTYVKDLARHSKIGQKIDRLRQSAISEQRRPTIDKPADGTPPTGDPTPKNAQITPKKISRVANRTMTTNTFKKKYSGSPKSDRFAKALEVGFPYGLQNTRTVHSVFHKRESLQYEEHQIQESKSPREESDRSDSENSEESQSEGDVGLPKLGRVNLDGGKYQSDE